MKLNLLSMSKHHWVCAQHVDLLKTSVKVNERLCAHHGLKGIYTKKIRKADVKNYFFILFINWIDSSAHLNKFQDIGQEKVSFDSSTHGATH